MKRTAGNDLTERQSTAQIPHSAAGKNVQGEGNEGIARLGVPKGNDNKTATANDTNDNITTNG
jgi:hypothetical protein